MEDKVYPRSGIPIRRTVDFLPTIFQTDANDKFLSGSIDAFIQPGTLEKTVGYVGKRYGKTFKGSDVYLDTDATLRSRYQLEPGVVFKKNEQVENFYDYLDFKNIVRFFGNDEERDDLVTEQEHYSWNPPIDWDKFINYREYYWVPAGPTAVRVLGQAQNVISTYRVKLGETETYIFYPDGITNNPTLTLYRGQTYKFIVNVPNNGLTIRINYDTGSLIYDPDRAYKTGTYVIFDGSLWRAVRDIGAGDGSTIDKDSQDWEYIETSTVDSVIDYNKGITNNGIVNGTITFEVPLDAPDILYYQSPTDPDRFGRIIVADIESNSKIDIDAEILGKSTYTSSNNIAFTNGLVVNFGGQVSPEKYAKGNWLVEGVGSGISLTLIDDLVIPPFNQNTPEIFFDNDGFDAVPFDDATLYPASKDYITIAKSSQDRNPWSRYNRWFHRDVLQYSSKLSGSDFDFDEAARAKRPIIEFKSNLQLFNHGSVAKENVDFVDDFTDDVFSKIEGSQGYSIDGIQLFEGSRILVIADKDTLANNRIYQVTFIVQNGRKQIALRETTDSISNKGEVVLIKRGNQNQGKMFWYDGEQWKESQVKTKVNQEPLFDVFDNDLDSLSDKLKYPVTSFAGTEIFSYKRGTGLVVDKELGFPISYLNIDNVGDIQFEFDWDIQKFNYEKNKSVATEKVSSGFYYFHASDEYDNAWVKTEKKYLQPILDYAVLDRSTSEVTLNSVNWSDFEAVSGEIYFYLNGIRITDSYVRSKNRFIFNKSFVKGDAISVKIFADVPPDQGYYEFPVGLEKNPLNEEIGFFTFGQASDHIQSGIDFYDSFSGKFPGVGNLRDLDGYQKFSKRFLKHANLAPVTLSLLADRQMNVIKAIKYAKKSYSDFKNTFLKLAEELYYDQTTVDFVDQILKEITKVKKQSDSFAGSDMIGNGAYSKIEYEVEDTGINVFALSQPFSLQTQSNRAVYVYIDGEQLLYGYDYQFNETLGFITIDKPLSLGNNIEIREYVTTEFNHIPPTPTKMGLYKKYKPRKYLDDTYLTPKEMIEGHDGSKITAFGDYRDDLLLELEKRIYNNIKLQYDENLYDNDRILGGYYKNSIWNKESIDPIINREFLSWISDTNLDYVTNTYFDSQESFTYTYTNMTDPTQTQNLPGWWRGVYKWFYDTDRPHTCPWEMLGFSEQPDWWESEYGPAPYTRGNLLLWEDLEAGIIKRGSRAGIKFRYARPGLINHIPVDGDGNLLSPLDSNLARDFVLVNNQGSFRLGDISPIENAWHIGSEYPYAVIIALALLNPFEFISYALSKGIVAENRLGQKVFGDNNLFITVKDIYSQSSLNVSYLVKQYLKNQNLSTDIFTEKLSGIDVALTHRLSGFVDQEQQKFLLDSKSPKSSTSSIFIPQENQQIIFNKSVPIDTITYAAVIIEKRNNGYRISGYDLFDPNFRYYDPVKSVADPLMTVGGVSEGFLEWTPEKFYGNGVIVRYRGEYYRSLRSHQADTNFDNQQWQKVPRLPVKGAVQAYKRRSFTDTLLTMTYGTVLTSMQEVVDFLLGYEKYLISKGFIFDGYDTELKSAKDWTTSCKEFMYWTQHNWAESSLLTLSPSADKVQFSFQIGVFDNLLDSFYDYQIYRSDGTPLAPEFINVKREFQKIIIESTNTDDGIYFIKMYQVLKEHVAIFDDRTVFNDVIYDQTSGYRQERIKVRGFRTVDWDGDYTSPGFIYDAVNIRDWQPFVDYRLGDIVSYKGISYTSQKNHTSGEDFDNAQWSLLDLVPNKGLIPNFDYRVNQFDDFYSLDSDGLQSSQKMLGRHAIGYQTRDYLQNLSEDEVTQFNLYQGFIRDKGTINAARKIFDKLSKTDTDSIILNEEWAIRVGDLGGKNQYREIEFQLAKTDFAIDPQPILFVNSVPSSVSDQYIRVTGSKFTIADSPFTPAIISKDYQTIQTAGYVKLDQVDFIISSIEEMSTIDVRSVREQDHVYVTFYKNSWGVFRISTVPLLSIVAAEKTGNIVTLTFNRRHALDIDQYIGIKNVPNLEGFFKVVSKDITKVDIEVPEGSQAPEVDSSTAVRIFEVKNARYNVVEDINEEDFALLANKSILWIDKDQNNRWSVIEKNKVYSGKQIVDYGTTAPERTGSSVVYAELLLQTITSIPVQSLIMTYIEGTAGLHIKEIIVPEATYANRLDRSFGQSLAISPDNKWLAVGAPLASGIISDFVGEFSTTVTYEPGDVVLEAGVLWRANKIVVGDGSTINIQSDDWNPITLLEPNSEGNSQGHRNQGILFLYLWTGQQWSLRKTILSPRPAINERFASNVSISKDGSDYWMSISAPGSLDERGRVYLFRYTNNEWQMHFDYNYAGVYDPSGLTAYYEGSIVWYDGSLWRCIADSTTGDGSSITVDSVDWIKIDPISTHVSLPTNAALTDDGSTLTSGILTPEDIAELTKDGDQFGTSMAMNKDGSILAIGTPNSDGQYFPKYRGLWRPDYEYLEGDVVKYQGFYHRLENLGSGAVPEDSNIRSYNQRPNQGHPWINVGDSTTYPSGKVYIYQRSTNNRYVLRQTISTDSLVDINDTGETGDAIVQLGDALGYSLDIDASGLNIVIGSPYADTDLQNQGVVYVLSSASLTTPQWRLKQRVQVFEEYNNILFGSSISISSAADKLVVGAKNAGFRDYYYFDDNTTFDEGRTVFSEFVGFTGQVYVFERVNGRYLLAEKLEATLAPDESFGYAVDTTSSVTVVGSPEYKVNGALAGTVRTFRKNSSIEPITVLAKQEPLTDISLVRNIRLIDDDRDTKIEDVSVIDSAKLKILGIADQEIKYKVPYDPATYTIGSDQVIVDQDTAWFSKNVGMLWWNISTAKWIYYEQGDLSYRIGNWNKLANGASVDVYEWIETRLLPSEWSALADTVDGLSNGISGQPLYPNDDVYSVKVLTNATTGEASDTLYYYWVKSSTIVPTDNVSRKISAADVANIIENPASSGLPMVAFVDSDKILAYNIVGKLSSTNNLLNIEFANNEQLNLVHKEYQLVSEGVADSLPSESVENKWIDSLVGFDNTGNAVPDPNIPEKRRYGILYRPRQGMFVDRFEALKIAIQRINQILYSRPFADIINYENLSLVDPEPSLELNEYDISVETFDEIQQLGNVLSDFFPNRVRQAILKVNVIDGEIDTIDIVDSGFGYKVTPYIEIQGNGKGATAVISLDTQGRVKSATVITRGKKYDSAIANVRQYSVLVKSDETLNGFWSVYSWDQQRRQFYRTKTQGFDTRKYWKFIDWWKEGYGTQSRIVAEITSLYQETLVNLDIGDLLRIKEYGAGGWAVLERFDGGEIDGKYSLVGRENGTIEILDTLYNVSTSALGFDQVGTYDANLYDSNPTTELRNIFKAVKENIFIDDIRVEWNNLFFSSIRYVLHEQQNRVDWVFKTSFVNAIHNIGSLEQKINYKNDSLESYEKYLEEIKPYRTTVREYTSRYDTIENTNSDVTDFDLPPAFSARDGKILPVNESFNRLNDYPWKYWTDNVGFSIASIVISNQGSGYTFPPKVLIEGNGSGAVAKAYISNGKVSGIEMLDIGSGYTKTPTVTLVGGNGSGASRKIAKAVAILDYSKARTFDLQVKFDRISKNGIFTQFIQNETFTATGRVSAFDLKYPPTRDKSKISIFKNGQIILQNEYSISLFYQKVGNATLLKGRLIFVITPAQGDLIEISYEKNDLLFDAVNRIDKYYDPKPGMLGKDVSQLMTGIDFGGVEIQGTTFDITGGWDALPWFTDSWDSIESNSDYYIVVDSEVYSQSEEWKSGSVVSYNGKTYKALVTNINEPPDEFPSTWQLLTFTLPYTPIEDQMISVYIKGARWQGRTVRIDDPMYVNNWDSSSAINPDAQMPSIVGDGSTATFNIQQYVDLNNGDIVIFRPFESDGSVSISDPNLLDTNLSGGTLSAVAGSYVTATGLTADEITVDGGKFISPESVPSPEENIPGQVLDSVSIKVFQLTSTGAAPLQMHVIKSDGSTTRYSIGLEIIDSQSVAVYVDKIRYDYTDDSTADYTIDFATNEIVFDTAPQVDKVIEIVAIGYGGAALLDYSEFIGDGTTTLFLTKAKFTDTSSVLVTVDGVEVDVGFINSTEIRETTGADLVTNRTMVQFSVVPTQGQIVKIISLAAALDTDSSQQSAIRVNRQSFVVSSSNRFELDRFVSLSRGSIQSSIIVELDGIKLKGPDTYYTVYDGTNNIIPVGVDPETIVTSVDIKVYINNVLQPFVTAYVYDGTTEQVIVNADVLEINDVIKIEIINNTEYTIESNDILVIDPAVVLVNGTRLDVTWFSEYPTFDLVSDIYTGGQSSYQLKRTPLSSSYVRVYLNGQRLINETEYTVEVPRNVVYIKVPSVSGDRVEIIEFGNNIYKEPTAFEIHKDMLNISYYKRYSIGSIFLTKDLTYYDQTIEVNDASSLDEPILSKNIPGIIEISGEKIQYMSKQGNVLGQLRRGALGTAIGTVYSTGTTLSNLGYTENIPYSDSQERTDFVSDGSSLVVGPLDFVPAKSSRNNWTRTTIPSDFGPSDIIEVFVAGKRLRKDPITVYDETLGSVSPQADKILEAEFSVDGINPSIRLTNVVPAGTRILIIRKVGKLWYERGETTASSGVTLLNNNTPIANFIDKKRTDLP